MWAADGFCYKTLEEVARWHLSKAALPSGHVLQSYSINHGASSISYQVEGSQTDLLIYPPTCDVPGALSSYIGLTVEEALLVSFAVIGAWALVFGAVVVRRVFY